MLKIGNRNIKRVTVNRDLYKSLAKDDYISDVKQILLRFFQKPYVLILYVSVLVLFATHIDSNTADILDQLLEKFPSNPIIVWAHQNFFRICGAIVFLPVVIDTNEAHRVYLSLVLSVFLLALPQRSVFEYFVYSVSLHIYAKSKHVFTKLSILVLATVACISFGIFTNEQIRRIYEQLPVVPTTTPKLSAGSTGSSTNSPGIVNSG
nr:P23 [Vinca ringspot virus]